MNPALVEGMAKSLQAQMDADCEAGFAKFWCEIQENSLRAGVNISAWREMTFKAYRVGWIDRDTQAWKVASEAVGVKS